MVSEILSKLKASVEEFCSSKYYGYGLLRIPSEHDNEVNSFISQFMKLKLEERSFIQKELEEMNKSVFLAFGVRMASYAVRRKSEHFIRQGLRGICISIDVGDLREDMIILSTLHDALLKIGSNADKVLAEIAQEFDADAIENIQGFINRRYEDKRPKAMGYEEGKDEEGFRYIHPKSISKPETMEQYKKRLKLTNSDIDTL